MTTNNNNKQQKRDWRTPFKSRRKWTAERVFLRVVFAAIGLAILGFAVGMWRNYRPLEALGLAFVACLFFALDADSPVKTKD